MVGCEISKSDECDMATIAIRCVLYATRARLRVNMCFTHHDEKVNMGQTNLFFIAALLNTRSSSARIIMIVWNQRVRLGPRPKGKETCDLIM